VIEDALEAIGESIAEVTRKYYGVTTGQVIDLADPLMLGRVRVRLPFVDAVDLNAWARVAVPTAGLQYGSYMLPDVGDEVLVAFEHGALEAPYILGALWTAMSPPPLASPLPQVRGIRTRAGNQIVLEDVPPAITIQTGPTAPQVMPTPSSPFGPHSSISMRAEGTEVTSPSTIRLQVGATLLQLDGTRILLQASGQTVAIGPDGISVVGSSADVTAGEVAITGGMVRINS
jgi:phage baseplate assembly protein gpV